MKKVIIVSTIIEIALLLLVLTSLGQARVIQIQLEKIRPQLKEEMVSVQTVKLDGEIYVCGTVINNRDNESLYCRGYADGYSWAVAQDQIDKQLNQ